MRRPERHRRRTYMRQWREHRQMTLVQVGAAIGWDHSSVSRLERGESPYNQDVLELLAHLYRCQPQDLLSHDPTAQEGVESELARQLAAASPEQREQATAVLSALLKSRR